MGHKKWVIAYSGCLVACAILNGLGMRLGVLACVACAGGCFVKWLVEVDKHQRAEHEKYLKKIGRRG